MRSLIVLALVGCGVDGSRTPDGSSTIDSPVTHPLTPLAVNCQDFTLTTNFANGTRTVATGKHALFSEIAIGDDFEVVTCGLTFTPPVSACAGTSCTGATLPPGEVCNVARRTGVFIGGKLDVNCGSTTQTFDANNVMTSSSSTSFTSIAVSH